MNFQDRRMQQNLENKIDERKNQSLRNALPKNESKLSTIFTAVGK